MKYVNLLDLKGLKLLVLIAKITIQFKVELITKTFFRDSVELLGYSRVHVNSPDR